MTFRTPFFAASLPLIAVFCVHDRTAPLPHSVTQVVTVPETYVITGDGAQKYETDSGWGAMPNGGTPGPTHGGVARDKAGHVYVSTNTKGILVFNPEGTFQKSIATEYQPIHSLVLREEKGEEVLYAAWLGGGQGLKLKLDGTVLLKIPCPMESGKYKDPQKEWHPTAVDSAPDGSIFVADGYGLSFIHKFDAAGKYLITFGGKGSDDNTFQTCHGLVVDLRGPKPLLLICDRENRRLQHFDLDGKFVANVAKNLRRPAAASFAGKMVVVAELEARVTILDGDNKEVAHLGDNPDRTQWANFNVPPDKWSPLYFTAPHGCCWDGNGGVYIQDYNATGRIRHLKPVK